MPTIHREHGYRFYFYSHEPNEPPHVHVDKGSSSAKFWLDPVHLVRNHGFSALELAKIERIVRKHGLSFVRAWNEFFGV
ncbi:MAG TPA: DUF4160 domain-containing protein [Dongiaceae bacterium]